MCHGCFFFIIEGTPAVTRVHHQQATTESEEGSEGKAEKKVDRPKLLQRVRRPNMNVTGPDWVNL